MNGFKLAAVAAVVAVLGCAHVVEDAERVVENVVAFEFDEGAELAALIHASAELATQGNDPDQVAAIMESCASRCKHECGGLNVASCFLNCSNHNCHPSCCGCKDGTAGCDGCGAACASGDATCGDVAREGS